MRGLGVVLMMVAACGGDDGMMTGDDVIEADADVTQGAAVTMHVLNGPTPSGSARPTHGPAHAVDGNWQISPDELRATLLELEFFGAGTVTVPVTDCEVVFDLREPGLAQHVACGFALPAGEYVSVRPRYDGEYQVLIDDAVNGIYTDPGSTTKLSEAQPVGGAQPITVGSQEMMGTGGAFFDPPLVVNDGDEHELSLLLDALQNLQIHADGGTLTLGADGNGILGFPDTVISIGTPASVAYYVSDLLGTPTSFGGPRPELSNNLVALSVLRGADDQPEFVHTRGAMVTECPTQQQFFFATDGYLGLDDAGTLAWAAKSADSAFSSLWRVATTETTQVECAATSADPAPSGGSFASGAPTFTAARTFAMTRLAD